jgi:hypothetical protein
MEDCMKSIVLLSAAAMLITAALPTAAAPRCSIRPPRKASDTELQRMAKISRSDAEQHARNRLKSRGNVQTASGGLEAERGCLIWSFDMKVEGEPGVQEVNVDAGNGKVLSVRHESAAAESSEAAKESRTVSGGHP